MGLSSKQVSSTDRLDWALNELLQDGGMELPKATASRQQLQQQQQQSEPARCPRCDSTNTKFCYYNNYNRSQPRHFCKTCRRHWTKGGTLRNVPVGGGRKNKRRKTANSDAITNRQAPIQTQQQQQSPTLPFSDQNNMPEILYRSLLHHQLQPDFSSNTHERYNTGTTNNNNNNFTTFLDSIRCLPPMPPIFAPLTSLSAYENEPSLSSLASEEVFEVGKEEIDLQLMNSHIALATPWPGQTSTFLDSVTWNWEDLASNFDAASDLKHPYENPSCANALGTNFAQRDFLPFLSFLRKVSYWREPEELPLTPSKT